MAEALYTATLLLYGVVVLTATARLTDRWLLAVLMLAMVPPTLMLFFLPDGGNLKYLAIPMSTGVTAVAIVRGLVGWKRPLRNGSSPTERYSAAPKR